MARFGQKELHIEITAPLSEMPAALADRGLRLSEDGRMLSYTFGVYGRAHGDHRTSQ